MIWNPALKNVLTYLGSADLQSAAKENAFPFVVLGDYKSPGFNRSNLFLRRISNPPGRLTEDVLNPPGILATQRFDALLEFLAIRRFTALLENLNPRHQSRCRS